MSRWVVLIVSVVAGLAFGFSLGRLTQPRHLSKEVHEQPASAESSVDFVFEDNFSPDPLHQQPQPAPSHAEEGCPQPVASEVLAPPPRLVLYHSGFPDAPTCGESSPFEIHYAFAGPDGGFLRINQTDDIFDFAIFDGQHPLPVADESRINGTVMRLAHLTVDRDCVDVVDRYMDQLELNDIYPLHGAPMGPQGIHYLSFRSYNNKLMNTLTILPGGMGCEIIASVTDASSINVKPTKLPEGMPGLKGASQISVTENREGQTLQRNINYVASASLRDAKAFFDAELGKIGFRTENSQLNHESGDDWRQSFIRARESLALSVTRRSDGSGVEVSMLWIQN